MSECYYKHNEMVQHWGLGSRTKVDSVDTVNTNN